MNGKPYRCYNPKCADKPGVPGHVFLVAPGAPVQCDRCGIKGDDPRFARFLTELVLVHFEPPSGVVDGVGAGYVACAPTASMEKTAAVRRSGAVDAVTCPDCRETAVFLAENSKERMSADEALRQVPIEINTKTGTMEIKPPVQASA